MQLLESSDLGLRSALDIGTNDTKAAARHLAAEGVVRCDAIEELPKDFDGYWIANPSGIVHIVSGYEDSGAAGA